MYAAIRVRGAVGVSPGIRHTLELLRLHRVNHLVLVDEQQLPMLQKVQSYITFGEIDAETLALLLQRRGRLPGNKRLDEKVLKEKKQKGFAELANALIGKKASLAGLGIKPVLRLNPPRKGYDRRGIKKPYNVGGALGNRGADINALIRRMM